MFQLLLLVSAVYAWTPLFYIDTYMKSGSKRVSHAGTSCQLYVKNGNGRTVNKRGPSNSDHGWYVYLGSDTSNNKDTWLWTSCGDAMLIDQALLSDNGWWYTRTWGVNGGGAWCLSTDAADGKGFSGKVNSKECYRTLKFAPNGNVYYYRSYTPGRRSLTAVPTLEDVRACEADESKVENGECAALVDQILTYDEQHPENLHKAETTDVPESLAMASPTNSLFVYHMSVEEVAVYAFAGVGLSFAVFQAYKFAKKKQHQQEFTPLQSRDEL